MPIKQEAFIEKAEKMIELNRHLYERVENFIDFIKSNYNPKGISTRLQKFYTLSFSEVGQELKKQNVSLTNEDETTLRQTFDRIQAINDEITQTDNEIDGMVYTLYGLTEEEIQIVEEETQG